MRKLDWYLLKLLVVWTLVVLVVLISFRGIADFVDDIGDVGQGDYTMPRLLLITLMRIPGYFYELFPVALLIGGLLGLGGLAKQRELMAMRAAGLSVLDLFWSLVKAGVILTLASILIGQFVAPYLDKESELLRAKLLHQQTILQSQYGVWIREGDTFVNIRQINPDGEIKDISVYDFDDDGNLSHMQRAERAELVNDRWQLKNVEETKIEEGRNFSSSFPERPFSAELDQDMLVNLGIEPSFLTIGQLFNYISFLHEHEQRSSEHEVVFWSKLASPLIGIMMLIMTLPFVMRDIRSTDIGKHLMAGIFIGVVFFLVSQTLGFAGMIYDVSPVLVAWSPVILLGVAIAFLYRRFL
ncbi:MAG: LPS export ABC transporter permease LptG [Sedimenticolaceae bacterium]|nr:LPS export ABC transporter permease LptG [Sedimenticolaceae bacterium]